MDERRRVGGPIPRFVMGLALVCGAALVTAACGDDDRGKVAGQTGGAGGDASGGETTGSGGTAVAGGETGEGGSGESGGTGTPGGASSTDAGAPGVGGASAGISLDEFCELRTRARQWLRECRPFFGDSDDWWGAQNIDLFCSSGRDAIEASRLLYNPVQAEACAALSVGGCNDVEAFAFGLGPQGSWLRTDACAGVVTGAVELGGECHAQSTNYASECLTGFCPANACPSTCTAYAGEGDDCDGTNARCNPAEAFCNAESKCQLLIAPGSECPGPNTCAPGVPCLFDEIEQASTCVASIPLGDACELGVDTCADEGVCYEQECVATVPAGGICAYHSNCPAGSYCNGDTCAEFVPVSGDCSAGTCIDGATCSEGICIAQGQAGEACPCLPGLWCDEQNECQAPGDVDDPCQGNLPGTCSPPLFCHPQLLSCTQPGAEDAPCNFMQPIDSCQAGLHCACTSGCTAAPHLAVATCQPRLADGQDCSSAPECLGGFCTDLKCAADPACR